MTKKSSQKFKYLEKEKIESIFHYFKGIFIEANQTIFLEGKSQTLTISLSKCPNYTKSTLPWKMSGFGPISVVFESSHA